MVHLSILAIRHNPDFDLRGKRKKHIFNDQYSKWPILGYSRTAILNTFWPPKVSMTPIQYVWIANVRKELSELSWPINKNFHGYFCIYWITMQHLKVPAFVQVQERFSIAYQSWKNRHFSRKYDMYRQKFPTSSLRFSDSPSEMSNMNLFVSLSSIRIYQ